MIFRTHILFALFFYLLFVRLFSMTISIIFTLLLVIGSILPDMDSPNSYVNKHYLIGIGKVISKFSEHRGFWHSIYGLIVVTLFMALITFLFRLPDRFIIALPLGYLLHLTADSFTVSGIKWFWKKGHIKGPIKTGSTGENIFFFMLIILTVLVILGKTTITSFATFIKSIRP